MDLRPANGFPTPPPHPSRCLERRLVELLLRLAGADSDAWHVVAQSPQPD